MRVLQLGKYYPPYRGGMESFLQTLAEGLAARGTEVDVLVSASAPRSVVRGDGRLAIRETARYGALFSQPLCPAYPLRARRAAEEAGLVHWHEPNPLADLTVRLLPSRIPAVTTYHSDVVRQRLAGRLLRPLLHAALGRARRIVTTWPGMAEASPVLRRHRERCVTIPLAVDPDRFRDPPPRRLLPEPLRRTPRPYLLFIGRLAWYKGLEVLFGALHGIDPAFDLAIIGTGERRPALEREAAARGVTERVRWVGGCTEEEKGAALAHAAALVLPSIAPAEVFGVVQLEAMASGIPVVNTALPSGVPWVARHEREALSVPPGDADALAAACGRLLGDEALRRRLGEAGRARVKKEFRLETMIDRYRSLYEEVAAGAEAGA